MSSLNPNTYHPPLRVTFGIIVLNGEPFLEHCLRALYPFAHEIIIVEGACEAARRTSTPSGHSIDTTAECIERFCRDEDPAAKIQFIRRNGYWPEKDTMCQAFGEQATGELLWQVDVDEFYHPDDMANILEELYQNPELGGASFKQLCFFGSFHHTIDGWFFRENQPEILRIFRWSRGYTYHQHRPPTVLDTQGRSVRKRPWLTATALAKRDIFLYHYSYVLPQQVKLKVQYYAAAAWNQEKEQVDWAESAYTNLKRPLQLHPMRGYASWLQRDNHPSPAAIQALEYDLATPGSPYDLRDTADLDRLVRSTRYRILRWGVREWGRLRCFWFLTVIPKVKTVRSRAYFFHRVRIQGKPLDNQNTHSESGRLLEGQLDEERL
jgi:hypothetical protein